LDGLSCDGTHWCAALTIDSLECTNGFTSCNGNCEEPVNSAFIQTNGAPTGPPSPQLADDATFTPNRSTLLMNPGDKLKIRIFDNAAQGALETRVQDLSTGQTGFMLACDGGLRRPVSVPMARPARTTCTWTWPPDRLDSGPSARERAAPGQISGA